MFSRNPHELSTARTGTVTRNRDLRSYKLVVDDDSMNDGSVHSILPGDELVLGIDVEPTPGQIVGVVIRGDTKVSVRRFAQASQKENGVERYELHAVNKDWQSRTVPKSDILLMGPMIQLSRKY